MNKVCIFGTLPFYKFQMIPVLSALVYSLWVANPFSRRFPMFPFLVLVAMSTAKWISQEQQRLQRPLP